MHSCATAFILTLLPLTACTAPNHIGNPLTLPISGLSNSIENAAYNSRRNQVETFVAANQAAIHAESRTSPGPAFAALFQTAGIPAQNQLAIHRDIAEISGATPPSYWDGQDWPPSDWVERVTVIAMVHGA